MNYEDMFSDGSTIEYVGVDWSEADWTPLMDECETTPVSPEYRWYGENVPVDTEVVIDGIDYRLTDSRCREAEADDGTVTTETFTVDEFSVDFENGSTIKAHHCYGGGGYGTTTGDVSDDAESDVSRLARKDDDDTDEHYECRQCGCQRSVDDYKRETRAWCDSEECDDIMWHERLDSHPNS
jgi:hypothetical protein